MLIVDHKPKDVNNLVLVWDSCKEEEVGKYSPSQLFLHYAPAVCSDCTLVVLLHISANSQLRKQSALSSSSSSFVFVLSLWLFRYVGFKGALAMVCAFKL